MQAARPAAASRPPSATVRTMPEHDHLPRQAGEPPLERRRRRLRARPPGPRSGPSSVAAPVAHDERAAAAARARPCRRRASSCARRAASGGHRLDAACATGSDSPVSADSSTSSPLPRRRARRRRHARPARDEQEVARNDLLGAGSRARPVAHDDRRLRERLRQSAGSPARRRPPARSRARRSGRARPRSRRPRSCRRSQRDGRRTDEQRDERIEELVEDESHVRGPPHALAAGSGRSGSSLSAASAGSSPRSGSVFSARASSPRSSACGLATASITGSVRPEPSSRPVRDPLRDASERTEAVKPAAAHDEEVDFGGGLEQRVQRLRVEHLDVRCQPRVTLVEIDVLAAQAVTDAKRRRGIGPQAAGPPRAQLPPSSDPSMPTRSAAGEARRRPRAGGRSAPSRAHRWRSRSGDPAEHDLGGTAVAVRADGDERRPGVCPAHGAANPSAAR